MSIGLGEFISGVGGNWVYDLLLKFWEQVTGTDRETLYLDAFAQAIIDSEGILRKYGEPVRLERQALLAALHQDLLTDVNRSTLSALDQETFVTQLAQAMCDRDVLQIGGHTLSSEDMQQVLRNLIHQTHSILRQKILEHPDAFNDVLLAEVQENHQKILEVKRLLETQLNITLQQIDTIAGYTRLIPALYQEMQDQGKVQTQMAEVIKTVQDDVQKIVRHLGLTQSQDIVIQGINAILAEAARGPMFEDSGLCAGYPLTAWPDRYFLAQEFSSDRADLRNALLHTFSTFGVQPIQADDSVGMGHILCKISGLIQSTRFGVYQLTASQNPNVHLELGIAMGLARPFVLVKEADAEVAPLIAGLDYYTINSYLELQYELGEKARTLLIGLSRYQAPPLPASGSERTAIIAHGNLNVLDFCIPIAKILTAYHLMPIILGDPTGKLGQYLNSEGIPHRIIGSAGRTRLDETVAAIQAARLGVYRIDPQGTADTFLALGVSIGLNRPGLLVHRNDAIPPSNVRGMGALAFSGFMDELPREFPQRFDSYLHRYSA